MPKNILVSCKCTQNKILSGADCWLGLVPYPISKCTFDTACFAIYNRKRIVSGQDTFGERWQLRFLGKGYCLISLLR